jgi:hypothetical protein
MSSCKAENFMDPCRDGMVVPEPTKLDTVIFSHDLTYTAILKDENTTVPEKAGGRPK